MNKRTLEDIYQNEINPAIYLKRAREISRRRIEEAVCGILLLFLLSATYMVVLVTAGMW